MNVHETDFSDEIKESIEEAWPLFVEFLKKNGARITPARKIILTQVFSRHDHFCADDLATELATGENHVSRGTVYRTLALMEKAGLVGIIRNSDVHAHYEHIFKHPHHEHMICDQCGDFIEFYDDVIMERVVRACDKLKFNKRNHRLVVFGTCEACEAKG